MRFVVSVFDVMFLTIVSLGCAQRAVGMGMQVLGDGEGELRAALPLAGVL